ncbi:hypothetical protein VNO77_19358 [Canavalia gladiata]|uniref:Uncharacterized protein n=1 Tax=Canavalia gladiata TaxID=3824 RepID=A0AAN9LR69_CANGL
MVLSLHALVWQVVPKDETVCRKQGVDCEGKMFYTIILASTTSFNLSSVEEVLQGKKEETLTNFIKKQRKPLLILHCSIPTRREEELRHNLLQLSRVTMVVSEINITDEAILKDLEKSYKEMTRQISAYILQTAPENHQGMLVISCSLRWCLDFVRPICECLQHARPDSSIEFSLNEVTVSQPKR